jgi:hypothetical protein
MRVFCDGAITLFIFPGSPGNLTLEGTTMNHAIKKPYRAAYNALKVLGVPVFTNEDTEAVGSFRISAEDETSDEWCNYYGGYDDWEFGVSPALDSVLRQHGLYAEWVNPGCLGVYEA